MVKPTTPYKSTLETIDVVPESTPAVRQGLLLRRLGAWATEVGLLAASGLIPFGLGAVIAQRSVHQVPLNPALRATQTILARGLKRPKPTFIKTVPPLTNLLWSLGLIAPVVVTATQIRQWKRTGQTLPQKWFELRIMPFQRSASKEAVLKDGLALHQIGLRELGRWGLPLGGAYTLGLLSGTGLVGIWLPGLVGLCFMAEGATILWNRDRRTWHDQMSGTWVVGTRSDEVAQTYHVPPEDIVEQSLEQPVQAAQNQARLPRLYGSELEDSLAAVNDQAAFVITEVESGLTSIILAPKRALPTFSHWPRPRPRQLMLGGSILGGLVVLAGAIITSQFYLQRQTQAQSSPQAKSDADFLATAATLIKTSGVPDEYQTAILALARIEDPRAIQYLGDLLTQASDPKVLAALQQALISQGKESFPVLQTLSQTLKNDLAMTENDAERLALLKRQQVVKRSLATLITLYDGELNDISFNKVDLNQERHPSAAFQFRLNDVDIAGTHWRGATLTQASLQNTTFFDPGLDGQSGTYDDVVSDFSGADLKETNLSHADFQRGQFLNTSLLRTNLNQSNLTQANLTGSNLTGAQLIQTTATGSQFVNSTFVGADLTQASFAEADFTGARLNRVAAAETTWTQANLQETYWLYADLSGANFSQANLHQAILQEANLKGADLTNAQLSSADLSNADLTGAILTHADLTGTDFRDARFASNRETVTESFITATPSHNDMSRLEGVDFSQAVNLSSQQLNYICAQGGLHRACR